MCTALPHLLHHPSACLQWYSLGMIILPLSSFFLVKHLLQNYFNVDPNVYAAVAAVLVVHTILIAFVFKAYQEDKDDPQEKKPVEKID